MSEPQELLPCIDAGEHRFTAIAYEFENRSGIEVYCTRCGITREYLTPGWEEQRDARYREALKAYGASL